MSQPHDMQRVPQPALVIAGMHRSGTSLTASLLADAGLHIGDRLLGPYPGNIRGHFEDLEFSHLHQRILAAVGLSPEGFTCTDAITVPARARAEAMALIDRRRAVGRPWGWKDPRTTLFLDLWAELIPESRFLFVFRAPWEVVDSLFRRGDEPFVLNPRFAVDLWLAYNRRIRDFVHGHADRCMLVETTSVAADPARFVSKVAGLLAVPLTQPAALYEPQLLTHDHDGHLRALIAALCPEAMELFDELRELAGQPPSARDSGPHLGDVVAAALAEWSARTVTARSSSAQELEHAAAVDAARAELDAARAELDAARADVSALGDQLQAERECFESLRLDLVGRLESATAGIVRKRPGRRDRKPVGQRVVAEYRRFIRRLGDERRRSA